MLYDLREQRTKRELDAGLREKIEEARKLRNQSDKIFQEIEIIIKNKLLDRNFAYHLWEYTPKV